MVINKNYMLIKLQFSADQTFKSQSHLFNIKLFRKISVHDKQYRNKVNNGKSISQEE